MIWTKKLGKQNYNFITRTFIHKREGRAVYPSKRVPEGKTQSHHLERGYLDANWTTCLVS